MTVYFSNPFRGECRHCTQGMYASPGECMRSVPPARLYSLRGEFLRVTSTSEGAQGYLCRAIASLVILPIVSRGWPDVPASSEALLNSCQTLYRRGCSERQLDYLLTTAVKQAARTNLYDEEAEKIHTDYIVSMLID